MRIVTPDAIEKVAWEGQLESAGAISKGLELIPTPTARVTLGEPISWQVEQALESQTGRKWSPPAGDRHYTLLRLDCTLHPPDEPRAHYTEATLTAYLRPKVEPGSVVAQDLYPQRVAVTDDRTYSLKLQPDLKFAIVNATLGEAGVEIEHHNTFPVIQAYGLGESRPYWQFANHAANPLLGCQSVYVVLSAPQAAEGTRLTIELVATLETRFGPVRLGLPQEANTHLSRVIG